MSVPTQIAFSISGGNLVARTAGAQAGDAALIPGDGSSIVEPRGEVTHSESPTPNVPAQIAFSFAGAFLDIFSAGANAGEAAVNRPPNVGDTYLQPNGVSEYFQPGGVYIYLRPA